MKMYSKEFHSGHLYLEIDDHEIDTLHPAVFETLMIQERKPLQVCISSDRSRLVELLRQSGFELKRRCYEMDVAASDLAVPLPSQPQSLSTACAGMAAYDSCVAKMYRHYLNTHSAVNPLTCSQEAFSDVLPRVVVYSGSARSIRSAAFLEENEIAYVCSSDEHGFMAFAASLVSNLFDRYNRIVFEADDTDWAAMQLKTLFVQKDAGSFDTYVKAIHPPSVSS